MTEHHDLRILGRLTAAQQHQPPEDPDHDEVEQTKGHKSRSCRNQPIRPNRRSQHPRRVLKRHRARQRLLTHLYGGVSIIFLVSAPNDEGTHHAGMTTDLMEPSA
jgi:hypothetical protein